MVSMKTKIAEQTVVYEIYIEEVVVWRRVVDIGRSRTNRAERVSAAREQERVSFLMAAAVDPKAELRRLTRRADRVE